MIRTLISTEMGMLKSKSIVIQTFLITLLLVLPFFFMSANILSDLNVGNLQPVMKANILEAFDNIFYFRMSLSFYLFVTWMLIPKAFYGKKISGEIEAVISIGYSAKNIWIGKSIATAAVGLVSSLPLFILFLVTYKLYIYLKYGFFLINNPLGFLFIFVINPLIIFGIILLIGGIQLVTDDYMKSLFALFVLAFFNVFSISFLKNLHEPRVKSLFLVFSLVSIAVLGITIAAFSKKVNNENFIISLYKANTKLFKLMKAVKE